MANELSRLESGRHAFEVVEQLYLLVDDDAGQAYQTAYQAALEAAGKPYALVDAAALTEAELLDLVCEVSPGRWRAL